jgi:hypothetical protein
MTASIQIPKDSSFLIILTWDSSVCIVSVLWDGRPRNRGSFSGGGERFFSSPQSPDRLWVHPASRSVGTGGSFPEHKTYGA